MDMLDLWHVPGLALAVIQGGQVVCLEGYGLSDTAQSLPVSAQTLFPIASCTKAFTVMALGMLVDAGKLAWDQPVSSYLPAFRLWDPYTTQQVTLRDLLTHRTGLPGHDMLWYATWFDRQELFNRLRYLEPTCDLRTTFQYQNLMYVVAGMMVEEIAGCSWQQFIQKRILDPLEMDRTIFSTRDMQQSPDYAQPYRYRAGSISKLPLHEINGEDYPLSGAGGMISCAGDMAKWLQFLLNSGKVKTQALICEETLQSMFTPHIFMDDPASRHGFGYEFSSYGLGWGMRSHKGRFLVEHDGMVDGYTVLASLMPREGLGIMALSNSDAYLNPVPENQVPNIISYTLYDQMLGLRATDWNQLMLAVRDDRQQVVQAGQALPDAGSKTHLQPAHPIESYLGEFVHPGYGRVSIQKDGDQLRMAINHKLELPMLPIAFDIFEAIFEITEQRFRVAFLSDLEGEINQVLLPMEPRVKAIAFTRVPQACGEG